MKKLLILFLILSTEAFSQNIVETTDGKIKGYTQDSIQVFKGVSFAQAPVGELRWKAPQPVKPWDGIKNCLEFGPSPIQNTPEPFFCWSEEFIAKPEPLSEDCLYLNIWSPAKKPEEKLPVFVWIYGGGLNSGSANCDIYDGEQMAKQGVVYVSLNYRVGILGFMAHPSLSKESEQHASGNYGFLDQLQALRWIKENISAFGGNPDNVTIAGQSAGSFSVNALIASPLAKSYFHKAIAQSGGLLSNRPMKDLSGAEQQGLNFMKMAEVEDLEELRNLSAEKLQELSNRPEAGRFGVVTDGYFLPKDIMAHFKKGKQNQVPVLTGWVTGDGSMFPVDGLTSASFKKTAQEKYGNKTDAFLRVFPAETDEQARASQQKLNLLGFAGTPAYLLAKYMNKNVWLYEFRHVPTDKVDFPNYGAFHTSEVPFALHTLDQWKRPWKPEERDLEKSMSGYWVNFAKTGNPNAEGLPLWKPYNAKKSEILLIDTGSLGMQKKYAKEFEVLTQ